MGDKIIKGTPTGATGSGGQYYQGNDGHIWWVNPQTGHAEKSIYDNKPDPQPANNANNANNSNNSAASSPITKTSEAIILVNGEEKERIPIKGDTEPFLKDYDVKDADLAFGILVGGKLYE